MIAFYACTNTQIMNMINVKLQYYPNDLADLLVLKKSRIDLNFIKCIKESGCFNRIVFIDPYICDKSKISKIYYYFVDRAPKKYYFKQLEQYIGKKIYDKILTFGFWADALYILLYLYKLNKRIDIEFVEEGIINYYMDDMQLYFCRTYGGVKEKIIRLFSFGCKSFLLKNNIRKLYMYRPDMAKIKIDIPIKPIHSVACSDSLIYTIMLNYQKYLREIKKKYVNSKYIYLLDGYDMNKHIEIIGQIIKNINNKELIVRVHPENTKDDIKMLLSSIPCLDLDYSNIFFELLLFQLKLENKKFFSRASSISYNCSFIFGIDIRNVLLYHLFDYRYSDKKELFDFADSFYKKFNYGNNMVIFNIYDI